MTVETAEAGSPVTVEIAEASESHVAARTQIGLVARARALARNLFLKVFISVMIGLLAVLVGTVCKAGHIKYLMDKPANPRRFYSETSV